MGKPLVVSMIFNNAQTIRAGLGRLRETTEPGSFRLALLDQHYPLRRADVQREINAQCSAFHDHLGSENVLTIDPGKNLGLHVGLNWALARAHEISPIDDSDVVVGYDPDECPAKRGWLEAMIAVLAAEGARAEGENRCGWLSMISHPARAYMEKAGFERRSIAGQEVWRPQYALITHVTAWPMHAIRKIGAFTEPHAFYGGIESAMQPRYSAGGYWHGYLAGHHDDHDAHHALVDPQYRQWKLDHVHGNFGGDFASYLDLRMAQR